MNVIYIDNLSFASLFVLVRLRRIYSHIYYLEKTKKVMSLVRVMQRLKLIKTEPLPISFTLSEIAEEGSHYFRISEDITHLCKEIEGKELVSNSIIKLAAEDFDTNKLFLFCKKIIGREIEMPVIYINAVKWHSGTQVIGEPAVYFLLKNQVFFRYLFEYGKHQGVKVIKYGRFPSSYYYSGQISRLSSNLKGKKAKFIKKTFSAVVKKIFTRRQNKPRLTISGTSQKAKIGALYAGRTITFDLDKRSEFFWLLKSQIPLKQVLVYFQQSHIPVNQEVVNTLKQQGMSLVSLNRITNSSLMPNWDFHFDIWRFFKFARRFFRYTLKLHSNYFYLLTVSYFYLKYIYWYDFFKDHNIKINFNPTDFIEANIAMQQAIEDVGGVSVSYHWSNNDFVSIFLSNCANIMFSFGPAYKRIFENNGSAIDHLVYCGYITDYAFKEVRGEAVELRHKIINNGAKFIICFFDENSDDSVKTLITNEKSANTYKYFLEKVLEDETIGLIFKPGYPRTIYQRIASISGLIDKAKATGRCVFIDKGNHISEQYPTEAAQAADLCVGLLLSGTAALESYLSGTPTVFLDLEKLYSKPIYQWGKSKVVFDNLDDLFSVIKQHRENSDGVAGFGDLSGWTKDRDPYKDGNASLRMGQYLNWLLEKFDEGKTREEAIEYANSKYKELWEAVLNKDSEQTDGVLICLN